jgi:hypothetical protein
MPSQTRTNVSCDFYALENVLIDGPDTFALANLFQVLETGMGIIGACLPLMRQPLRQFFPWLMGTSHRRAAEHYEDSFSEHYVLQNVSSGTRFDKHEPWNSVTVSGPTPFDKSASRKESDELGIIEEMYAVRDGESGRDGTRTPTQHELGKGIRKDFEYSIARN